MFIQMCQCKTIFCSQDREISDINSINLYLKPDLFSNPFTSVISLFGTNSMVERDSCSIEYPLGNLHPIQVWDLSRISSKRIFITQMVPNEFGAIPTVTGLNLTLEQSILSLQNYSFYYFALFDISKSLVCELGPTSIDGYLLSSADSKKVIYLAKSILVDNSTIPVVISTSSPNSLDSSWIAVIILSVVAVLMVFILAFLRLKKKSRFRRRRLNQTHLILPPSLDSHSYQPREANEEEGVELPSIVVSSPSSTSSTISTLGEDFQNIDHAKPFFDVENGLANSNIDSNKFLSVDENRIVLGEPIPFDISKSLFSEHIHTDNSMVSKNRSNLESTSTNHDTSPDVQNIQNIPTEDLESSSIPDSEYYDAQSMSSLDHTDVRWETRETEETGDDLSFQSAKSQLESSVSLYYSANGSSISRSSQSNQSMNTRPSSCGSVRNSKSSDDRGGYLTAESESEGEDVDAMSIASNVAVADRIYFPGDIARRERRASCVSETTIKQGSD